MSLRQRDLQGSCGEAEEEGEGEAAHPMGSRLPHPELGQGLQPLPWGWDAECRETGVEGSSDYRQIGLPDGFQGPLCGLVFITP